MAGVSDDDGPNAGQPSAWDGPTGDFWADNADRFDRGVASYRDAFLRAAAIGPDDEVLDIGCGAGQSTRDAARRASRGHAHGIDLSRRLLDVARRRAVAEGLGNLTFTRADAQLHPYAPDSIDVAISRHGVMFFADPHAAFTNIAGALRPGGRLVLLVWQPVERQEFIHQVLAALTPGRDTPLPPAHGPSPVSLGDPDRVTTLLEGAGFTDVVLDGIEQPMSFGDDPDEALDYQSGQHAGLIAALDPDTRALALSRLRDDLAAHHIPGRGVLYGSAAWLVHARRRRS